MRIEEVRTIFVHDWLLVRVQTDAGIAGVGQATFWAQPRATAEVVREFSEYLVGKDPLTIDYHWQYLYRSASFRGASINAALSAIDVALWDIAGRHFGAPAYALLGGRHRDKIRMCALCMDGDKDKMLEEVTNAVKDGHTAVKIDPLPDDYPTWSHPRLVREVVGRVGAARDAIGEDVDLVVEAHRKLGPGEAVALAKKLERFDLLFMEDPIPPDSVDSMAELASKTRIPIATGERLHTIYEFKEVLTKGAAQDLKLDAGLQGGLTQCKKIAGMAEAYHATVSPHNAWGPLLTAIHVQLAAAIPNFLVLEYRPDPRDEIVKDPLNVVDGHIQVPEKHGIGVEIDEEAAARFPCSPRRIDTAVRADGSVAFR